MKRSKVLAVSAIMLGLASMVFANPDSNTKKSTAGLISDNAVDKMATGVEEGKGVAFVELYDVENGAPIQFNVGAGSWFNDNLWMSLFYTNSNDLTNTVSKTVARKYQDVDGDSSVVDTTTTNSDTITGGTLVNNVSFNVFSKSLNLGGEFFYNSTFENIAKNDTKTVTDTVSTADYSETINKTNDGAKYSNNFGVKFNGLQTKADEKNGFYLALNSVDVTVNGTSSKTRANTTATKYGDVIGAGAQTSEKINNIINRKVGAKVEGELGMDLPAVGLMSTTFVLEDALEGYGTGSKYSRKYNSVTTTNDTKTTQDIITKRKYGADFEIANTLTPKFNFSFDAGSRVKVLARVSAPVAVSYSPNNVDYTKTVTTTVVENLNDGTSTKTVEETQTAYGTGNALKNQTELNLNVSPEVSAGIVWAVVPEKFNLNFGVKANAGSYDWTTTTLKASKKILTNKTTTTNEFGVETVTSTSEAYFGAADNTDSRTTVYRANSATVTGSLGATIFFTDKVSLDMAMVKDIDGFGTAYLFMLPEIDVLFSVKF